MCKGPMSSNGIDKQNEMAANICLMKNDKSLSKTYIINESKKEKKLLRNKYKRDSLNYIKNLSYFNPRPKGEPLGDKIKLANGKIYKTINLNNL